MTSDASRDLADQLIRLLDQAADPGGDPLPRVAATVAAKSYLEGLTRHLVDVARESGASWQELADVFATTPANVQNRFDSYRRYEDD
ncbi:MAG: hypothetical protein KY458_04660 [Actinobacteria bacterium]|nr:hypothetical protein [Actinomycetota bacterium]